MQMGTIIRYKHDNLVNQHVIKKGTIAMIQGIDTEKPDARKVICEDGFVHWTYKQNIKVYCDIIKFK